MAEDQGAKKVDAAEQLRGMRDTYMDVWAKAMGELVNTDAYAQQSGAALDAYIAASQPFRASLEKAMLNALQQLSMPTRPDFISLAERLTNLEMRLDDMDNKLDRIGHAIAQIASTKKSGEQAATPKATDSQAPRIAASEVPLSLAKKESEAVTKTLADALSEAATAAKTLKEPARSKKSKKKGAR